MTESRARSPLSAFAPALASVPIAVGIAVGCGAWSAWHEVAAQQYGELGFSRSGYVAWREALESALRPGLEWGLAVAIGLAVLAGLVLARGARFDASSTLRLLRSTAGIAWLSAVVALGATTGLIAIEREHEWIGRSQIVYALAVALASVAVLVCLGRYARASDEPRRAATAVAGLHALALLVVGGFWVDRDAVQHPWERETWVLNALLLGVATAVFAGSRGRRVAEFTGGRVRALTGPLGIASLLGLVLAALALACGALDGTLGTPTLAATKPLNVVFIGIDTLRADATSLYGPSLHGRDTTPELRELASRGYLFDEAVSQAPWTMPAFASMFTGKYPHEHGAYSLSGALREREVALAEVLREAGYATRGVVSHSYLGAYHGFQQGFDVYDESQALGHDAITSAQVTDRAIDMLAGARDRPFFLFAHYFDAHYEYMDHAEWPWADGYQGWLRHELDFENLIKSRHLLGQAEKDWLVDLYEEEIAYLDREIGRLLAWLDSRGLGESTWIVVAGDHGEEFLDHQNYGHTTTLYEEQLHVPLIVVPPGGVAGRRVAGVVETRAIFGTLLEALGVPFAPAARERSLLGHIEAAPDDAKAFSVVWLPDAELGWGKHMRISSLREGRWKLIRDYTRDVTALFDLQTDPRELHDLCAQRRELVEHLQPALETWTQEQQNRGGVATTVPIDADQARTLHELGYL